ncbi:UPF0223 family protein [Lacticaseibacillus casei]|jgi:uncharacterized protein YktA (UPF0223 family)|uniref:UPF0223 protein LHUE1_002381 n=1 Tax=Lacticaseibacillus huelsenbergensis TaxID=3035291 RepID=A0ABY8DPB5_9LACO|nr:MULTISPECIES: UPF0223 family protein [Lacticaseibacillus]MDG3061634.1 UPF0223 family protein [Lacticaseibacillus sp. BCRC 81376]QVI37910.1 UPF0223 family protein [Lacticaseibacillus casei]QXG59700.1 UPF0223 family protein [Lacticaseibacillus casei]WFB38836.1 UPF0223 family protein [Lacticaseibacillus huelsenbergensis]WFB43229.1 UPF0223 family protein [Lacticaseibacillus huelsenbergensis]
MKPNYSYPLDLDWTTDEKIKVTTFFALIEDAYEHGVDRDNLLAAYRGFKQVVPDKGTERQLDREFEALSGYSMYTVVQMARQGVSQKIKVKVS